MTVQNEKNRVLLDFLDNKIFSPIMEALPEQYSSEREQNMLNNVKKYTVLEMEQFHRKDISSEEIREIFFHELYNETTSLIGKEREDLELPRFLEIREQFVSLCKELAIC